MEENKYLNFFTKHWSKLLLGFLAIASLAAWGERFFSANRMQSQQDFLIGAQILEQFYSGNTLPIESIETAEVILERHPELHPKYDTMLAMTYLSQRNPNKGLVYAKAPLKHVELPTPYLSYGATTLLIAEKRFDEAYQQAQALYTDLQGETTHTTLYGLNLLRLISLETEMGAHSTLLEEFKSHPAYPEIISLFQKGTLSFEDWHPELTQKK